MFILLKDVRVRVRVRVRCIRDVEIAKFKRISFSILFIFVKRLLKWKVSKLVGVYAFGVQTPSLCPNLAIQIIHSVRKRK